MNLFLKFFSKNYIWFSIVFFSFFWWCVLGYKLSYCDKNWNYQAYEKSNNIDYGKFELTLLDKNNSELKNKQVLVQKFCLYQNIKCYVNLDKNFLFIKLLDKWSSEEFNKILEVLWLQKSTDEFYGEIIKKLDYIDQKIDNL